MENNEKLSSSFDLKSTYPEFPYSATNYDEPCRGQYHFSSQSGWMNDINGLWFYKGVYHLSYQHCPHSTTFDGQMHWGRATSTDMIHWKQQPIMLELDDNVPGSCWSGSTVVDVDNTSGLQTGTDPVFVTLYTATSKGTCLAYSNDNGMKWKNFEGNPLQPGAEEPRDPHVLWYSPLNQWIMLLYENGTTFYTSPNLIDWTYASNFDWGYECPDFFELALDGDQNKKKWVLHDGSGKYFIGNFDGSKFTPDPGGPYEMNYGPDFYAAQSFYRETLPDSRVIQMAWLGHWGGGLDTEPWKGEATFPVELKLKEFEEGIRLVRIPISEICSIYDSSQYWDTQLLTSDQELFIDVKAKCYDIMAEFDLANTSATEIRFQSANKTVIYDIANMTLLGKALKPINNKLKIRILGDWGQFEIFANDGAFCWSETFAFTQEDCSIGLTVNGNILLVSAEIHKIKTIWPRIIQS